MKGPVEIVPGVYGLGDEMVNWYVVDDGARLTAVDAGVSGVRAATSTPTSQQIGHTPADVDALVLTHSDADHTGIAPQLQKAGARVLIHSDDDATLRKPGPKKGDASPRHMLKYLWRPSFWRLMVHLGRRGGGQAAQGRGRGDVRGRRRARRSRQPAGGAHARATLPVTARSCSSAKARCSWATRSARGIRSPGLGAQRFPSALNVSNAQALNR